MLEIGCSFGHITEYLDDEPAVAAVHTFDVDEPFVEITRTAYTAEGRVVEVNEMTADAGAYIFRYDFGA